ncbi:hypothetical protein ACF061_20390 [Streptomyces sp. NPDC015220]|uniref:hypothetical protein n=1 Tax=Streptomyces sp. NPDC015220 TaxID=3364947 RepID=UPI0036FB9461
MEADTGRRTTTTDRRPTAPPTAIAAAAITVAVAVAVAVATGPSLIGPPRRRRPA